MTAAGRILRGVGGLYWVAGNAGEVGIASARGLFRKQNLTPTVGDRVFCSPSGDPDVPLRLETILPRKNYLVRPPVANLDCLVITLSAADPPPDFYLVDKLLIVCRLNQIEPLICLTKTDLTRDAHNLVAAYQAAGFKVIETRPDDEAGLEQLKTLITGRVVSFTGQSGVGKSTLFNRLCGAEIMPAGDLSSRSGRGRQTTRRVELIPLLGGYLADTPGFSSLELFDLNISGPQVAAGFPEIEAIEGQCRFTGCRHLGELGCAVGESGIDPERLLRYRFFRNQLDSLNPYSSSKPRLK